MSLPMNSLYSLTWGDYGTSLVSAVQLLRCHGDLVDCTLAAGGRSFPAHKIVLCAASPFLLDLLKNTPCKHPIVMLAGVNASDLEALLEFVYRGEVSVDHSQLPSLLQAAHCLNIQGLAPQTVTKDDYNTTSIQLHPSLLAQHHVKAVIDNEDLMTAIHDSSPQHQTIQAHVVEEIMPEQLTEVTDVKEVINQLLPTRKRKPRVKKPTVPKSEPNITNTENEIENSPPKAKKPKAPRDPNKTKSRSQSEQPASCPICGAVIKQSRNLRRHLELRHFSKPGIKKERKSGSGNIANMQTVTVKKEPEDISSTSQHEQGQQIQIQQPQTIAVTVAGNQATHTIVETGSNSNANQPQHIVTHHDNSDGSTSLQIAQVQNLPGTHQLTLSNLNQSNKNHIVLKKVIFVKGNNTNT